MRLFRRSSAPRKPGPFALIAQGGALACVALLGLVPPSQGSMVLIPLTNAGAMAMQRLVDESGAVVTGVGRLPGARFVTGARDRIVPRMLAHGVLVLPGNPPFCGTPLASEPQ